LRRSETVPIPIRRASIVRLDGRALAAQETRIHRAGVRRRTRAPAGSTSHAAKIRLYEGNQPKHRGESAPLDAAAQEPRWVFFYDPEIEASFLFFLFIPRGRRVTVLRNRGMQPAKSGSFLQKTALRAQ